MQLYWIELNWIRHQIINYQYKYTLLWSLFIDGLLSQFDRIWLHSLNRLLFNFQFMTASKFLCWCNKIPKTKTKLKTKSTLEKLVLKLFLNISVPPFSRENHWERIDLRIHKICTKRLQLFSDSIICLAFKLSLE